MNNKKLFSGISVLIFLIFLVPTISAQSTEIPAWVKGVANFWAEGNITDAEFGESISFLIEQGIIKVELPYQTNNLELERKISQLESENSKLKDEYTDMKRKISQLESENSKLKSEPPSSPIETKPNPIQNDGFSDLICKQESGIVKMSGRYTNNDQSTSGVFLKLIVLDANQKILATGIGSISEMKAYETKYFDAVAFYPGAYSSCDIQIELK